MIVEQLSVGSSARSRHSWDALEQAFSFYIPPYPGTSILRPYTIPAPPLLPSLSDQTIVLLAHCLTSVMQSRYTTRWRAINSRTLPKLHIHLGACANALYTQAIAPAAWFIFSVDQWRYTNKQQPPSVKWLCSTQRITERKVWFEQCAASYSGGQLWVAPAHEQLHGRWCTMQRALLDGEFTQAAVMRTVDEYLSNTTYRQLVHDARVQYVQMKRRVKKCLDAFDCIW